MDLTRYLKKGIAVLFILCLAGGLLWLRHYIVRNRVPQLTLNTDSVELVVGDKFDPLEYVASCTDWNGENIADDDHISYSGLDEKQGGEYDVTITATNQYKNTDSQKMHVTLKYAEELYIAEEREYPNLFPDTGIVYKGMGETKRESREFMESDYAGGMRGTVMAAFMYGYDSNQYFQLRVITGKEQYAIGIKCEILETDEQVDEAIEASHQPAVEDYSQYSTTTQTVSVPADSAAAE